MNEHELHVDIVFLVSSSFFCVCVHLFSANVAENVNKVAKITENLCAASARERKYQLRGWKHTGARVYPFRVCMCAFPSLNA